MQAESNQLGLFVYLFSLSFSAIRGFSQPASEPDVIWCRAVHEKRDISLKERHIKNDMNRSVGIS